MALSICPDCKKEFSTDAEACPHCGHPHKRRMSAGCLVALLLAGAAIFSFFYFAPSVPPRSPTSADATTQEAPSPKWETITGTQQGEQFALDIDTNSIQRSTDGASASVIVKVDEEHVSRVTYICRSPDSGLPGAVLFEGKVIDLSPGSTSSEIMLRICYGKARAIQSTEPAQSIAPLPSPSAIQSFETEVMPIWQDISTAETAARCQLRSEQWLNTFLLGEEAELQAKVAAYHLLDVERDRENQKMQRYIAGQFPTSQVCEVLTNSPTMDRLDMIEDKMIGGYH